MDEKELHAIQTSVSKLKLAIRAIHRRNVEKDRGKEFEGSYTRVVFIMIITYVTLFGYMTLIGTENAALNAIIPTLGFNISTWSLPCVKELWISFKTNTGNELESVKQTRMTEEQDNGIPVDDIDLPV